MRTELETFRTNLGDRVELEGWIILTMPLPKGALAGRTHTSTCTLCRARKLKVGEPNGPHVGVIGFFLSVKHRDMMVNNHMRAHMAEGELIHIVNLPSYTGGASGGEGLRGDSQAADRPAGDHGEVASDLGVRSEQEG